MKIQFNRKKLIQIRAKDIENLLMIMVSEKKELKRNILKKDTFTFYFTCESAM
jgi:hypothetical protein